MDIQENWGEIKKAFIQATKSSLLTAMATVNPDGSPHVVAIGSLTLREPCRGFYFEEFPSKTKRNLNRDPRVTVMAVNTGRFFWLTALLKGRFSSSPGLRISGRAGERRPATEEEKSIMVKRVRPVRGTRGYNILWRDMKTVRDIHFESFEPIHLGAMTRNLWKG
jgi:hypothetical protein